MDSAILEAGWPQLIIWNRPFPLWVGGNGRQKWREEPPRGPGERFYELFLCSAGQRRALRLCFRNEQVKLGPALVQSGLVTPG